MATDPVVPRDPFRRSTTYAAAGALLALGAPIGLMCLRRCVLRKPATVRDDIQRDLATYAYLAWSTTLVFALAGHVLGRTTDRLARLSVTDGLTGLLNPRAFNQRLRHEVERSKRSGGPLALLVLDLDRFKSLNDAHGHAVGDRALTRVGRAIFGTMRAIDVGGRLGGDEFGLLAANTTSAAATVLAERLREAVAREASREQGSDVTVSIGVVTFEPAIDRLDDGSTLMRAADDAMYAAKHAGRNRIAVGRLPATV
jgi:diguanylate cyclase (GGDEF)-like protein